MEYYSPRGNLDTTGFVYYDEGSCAKVYKKGQLLLKTYKLDCKYYHMISPKLFNFLKNADFPHMLKLRDYYYLDKSLWNKIIGIEAYTMDYAGERIPSLLNASTEYLLDMVSDLEKMIALLSKQKIIMKDTHGGNIIFSENDVTVIDPDQFSFAKFSSYASVLKRNKYAILNYIISSMVYEIEDDPKGKKYCFDLYSLKYVDLDCLAKSLKDFFTEETPYLSLKNKKY